MSDLGFVYRYAEGANKKSPVTLLLLHGTGGNEDDLLPLGATLLPGASLLSPRGKVLEHGMPRFFRRFAEGVFDIEDLKYRTDELASFITAARREHDLGEKIIAVGYSNGANIAASLLLVHPHILHGAVLFRAMVPFVPEVAVDLQHAHVLISGGRLDRIASPQGTQQLARLLEQSGATVSLSWHDGGHQLGQDDVDAARHWLAEIVAPPSAA